MSPKKWIAAILSCLCLLPGNKGQAQTDRVYTYTSQWLISAYRHDWDSAFYYEANLSALVKKEFGDTSLSYALVLSGIAGQTYFAMQRYDSAVFFYRQGVDLFKKSSDTANDIYYNILSQYENATLNGRGNTDSMMSAWRAAAHRRWRADHPYGGQLPAQPSMEKFMSSLAMPDYAQKAMIRQQTYIYKKGGLDTVDDEYLRAAFDLRRWSAHVAVSHSGILENKYGRDSLPVIAFEYLYTGFALLKDRLADQRKKLATNIIYNSNFTGRPTTTSIDQDNDIQAAIRKGSDYLARQLYGPAETIFRQEIRQLRKAKLYHSGYMEQSLTGLCTSLLYQQKYKEAADSLIVISSLAFSYLQEELARETESSQYKQKKAFDAIFDMLYTCLYHLPQPDRGLLVKAFTLELQRANDILYSQIDFFDKARNAQNVYFTQSFYRTFLNTRQALSRQYSLPLSQRTLNEDSLEILYRNIGGVIFGNGFLQRDTDSAKALTKWMADQPATTANIEFIRFNYKTGIDKDSAVYAAFLFRQGEKEPVFLPLCSEATLTKLLKDEKGAWMDKTQLTQYIYDPSGAGAAALYRLIWQPLEPYLAGITDINYTPAGLLNNIALQAVYTGKDHLMNTYTLHRFMRLTDATRQKTTDPAPREVSIWGNMNYGSDGFPSLAGSGEIDSLKNILTAHGIHFTIHDGNGATEEAFKRQASSLNGVLHISTHGFYARLDRQLEKEPLPAAFISANTDPLLRCGLVFSGVNYYWTKGIPHPGLEDGLLTGYETAVLDLHNIQLVTLSACETGLGDITDNEGTLGIQRAFKMAGVKKLLVSLWDVNADATAQLLSLFYANWLQGMSLSEALQKAERTLQQSGLYAPYYWAGFVLVE